MNKDDIKTELLNYLTEQLQKQIYGKEHTMVCKMTTRLVYK